jgi:hypothetical protein
VQNVIDFIAISPDYIELVLALVDPARRESFSIFFVLRMLRLCRIFRLIRHVPGLWILLYTLKASFNELMLMFVFLLIGMVVFATLMHFAERENGFSNIPLGFWWSVVTMTTVGYGDMVPETAAGYVIGSCCAVAGLLMIAFTVPIIVSNFVLYYTHVQYGLARRDRELELDLQHTAQDCGGDSVSCCSKADLQGVSCTTIGTATGTDTNTNNDNDNIACNNACLLHQHQHHPHHHPDHHHHTQQQQLPGNTSVTIVPPKFSFSNPIRTSTSSSSPSSSPIPPPPPKEPADSLAITLGENVALTSAAASLEEGPGSDTRGLGADGRSDSDLRDTVVYL